MERLPSSTAQMACRLRRYGLPLGTDTADGNDVYLNLKRLGRHLHLIGPPGAGKTRVLLGIFEALCALPKATVIVINPKGALGRMSRDWMIEHSMAKRLVWFDPRDPIGYNPMEPNGLGIFTHAKVVREGIRSAWGQSSFDETPRLAKYLLLGLAVARTLELGLLEALQFLRPGARLRKEVLPRISDRFLWESLSAFDELSRNTQQDYSESAVSRLEAFVCDPINLRMLTHTPTLNLSDVIERHQVLLVNLEIGQPLVEDDVKLWGRFLVNDVLNHVRRRQYDITPVYLLCDEVQFFATRDLCQTLATGRELGLHLVAVHQELSQLRDEDKGGDLYHSIMGCARTKLLFGGLSVEDLKILAPEVKIDQYSPLIVKDERTSLEITPVESTRQVITHGDATGGSAETFKSFLARRCFPKALRWKSLTDFLHPVSFLKWLQGNRAHGAKFVSATKNRKPVSYIAEAITLLATRGKAIDLGCGAGVDAQCLAQSGFEVVAIDSNAVAIQSTTELCNGLPVKAMRQDIRDVKLSPRSIDLAMAGTACRS